MKTNTFCEWADVAKISHEDGGVLIEWEKAGLQAKMSPEKAKEFARAIERVAESVTERVEPAGA